LAAGVVVPEEEDEELDSLLLEEELDFSLEEDDELSLAELPSDDEEDEEDEADTDGLLRLSVR
jgi:hypothetical protein